MRLFLFPFSFQFFTRLAAVFAKEVSGFGVFESEEGRTVVLQRGKEVKVLAINEVDEKFHASPAIVGDAIYLRGEKHLFCFAKLERL